MIDKKDIHEYIENEKGLKYVALYENETAEAITKSYDVISLGDELYTYKNGVYIPDLKDDEMIKTLTSLTFPKFATKTKLFNIITLIKIKCNKNFEELNDYPEHWVNFQNGVFNPIDTKLYKHDPKHLAMNQIPHGLDRKHLNAELSKIKTFNKFITSTIPNADDREMLFQFMAYCFTRSMKAQKALFIVGEANTGKSVLLRLIEKMIGYNNVSNIELQELSKQFNASGLLGKLVNVHGDLTSTALKDTSTFKNVTGEDSLRVEKKYKEAITIRPYAKFIYSMNRIPKQIDEQSEGFYRRLLILRIPKRGDEIFNLEEELEKEIPYIMGFLMNKLNHVVQHGYDLFESPNSIEEVRRLKELSDSVEAFLNECVIFIDEARELKTEVYSKYNDYCIEYGRKPLNKSNFYNELREMGVKEVKSYGYRYLDRVSFLKESARHDRKDNIIPFTE